MNIPIIGYVTLYHIFSYFFIYGFLGWVVEVVFATLKTGKFVNRGFLNGPICPIYGVGMALCILLLNTLADKWWLLIIVGGVLATVLELITGFILDKIFKTKWWDYSKEPFNIGGYVCLRFTILWGLGILLVFKTIVPLVDMLIKAIPFYFWGLSILVILITMLLIDFSAVIVQLKNLKKYFKEVDKIVSIIRGNSDKIGSKISELTVTVSDGVKEGINKIKSSRLGKAFPSLKNKGEKIEKHLEESEESKDQNEDKE